MPNPYTGRPSYTFWRQAVTECAASDVDPVLVAPFRIRRSDAVATAGSCFAQHISQALVRQDFHYLVTEQPTSDDGTGENYGVFPARFGNIYTARQLLQLFQRAYGLFKPETDFWPGKSGEIIDPFRPRIQAGGFASVEQLRADREIHFAAVRRMFEQCGVFIFTLGLTEAWISKQDGAVVPLAPGVVAPHPSPEDFAFHNFRVHEVVLDLEKFLRRFAEVNPKARIILTVSPIPLVATYENRHVLVSTIASKSILRAAVDEIVSAHPEVVYFPSYEMVTGPQAGNRYYGLDLREVTSDGVARVMSLFSKHYLDESPSTPPPQPAGIPVDLNDEDERRMAEMAAIICDEEAIIS